MPFILFALILLAPYFSHAANWAPGSWTKNEGGDLSYWLYVPKNYHSGNNGLVLQLHGCFSKADSYKENSNWQTAAEAYRLIVAIPQAPEDGSIRGCWGAIGSSYESSRHTELLFNLTQDLKNDPRLNIDSNAVYSSGLSAGATQTMLLGCKYPDVFAGIAVVAGPMLGSQPKEVYRPSTTTNDVIRNCQRLARGKAKWLRTQKTSVFVSDRDWVVNPVHSERTYGAIKQIYGATTERSLDLTRLPGRRKDGVGVEALDSFGQVRISYIIQQGLGHAWPTGVSAGSSEDKKGFNGDTINYPLYLGEFFSSRRLR